MSIEQEYAILFIKHHNERIYEVINYVTHVVIHLGEIFNYCLFGLEAKRKGLLCPCNNWKTMQTFKIYPATLELMARQLDLVRPLVLNTPNILLESIGKQTFLVTFLTCNEDMFAIIDLLEKAKLWYQKENAWKYYKTGI